MRAVVDRRIRPRLGAQVHLRLRPHQVHIFDAAGGRLTFEPAERITA
jgi:hypothetical protein